MAAIENMKGKKELPIADASPFNSAVRAGVRLSLPDQAFLHTREKIIDRGRETFLEVGRALLEIRDHNDGILYKKSYGTFEAYCQERWGFGKAYAYRLMGAAKIAEELSPRGDEINLPAPEGEKQIRVLSLLEKRDDRRAAWKQANEEAGDKEI